MRSREQSVDADAVRAALVETLAAEPDIVAAYLFGSLAQGTPGPLSDVDVALLAGDQRRTQAACERTMDFKPLRDRAFERMRSAILENR